MSNRDFLLLTLSIVVLQNPFRWKYCSGLIIMQNHSCCFQP